MTVVSVYFLYGDPICFFDWKMYSRILGIQFLKNSKNISVGYKLYLDAS